MDVVLKRGADLINTVTGSRVYVFFNPSDLFDRILFVRLCLYGYLVASSASRNAVPQSRNPIRVSLSQSGQDDIAPARRTG